MPESTEPVTIICNGSEHTLPAGTDLDGLLRSLNLVADHLVVELNQRIIQPDQYAGLLLEGGDRVELIRFVGGG